MYAFYLYLFWIRLTVEPQMNVILQFKLLKCLKYYVQFNKD